MTKNIWAFFLTLVFISSPFSLSAGQSVDITRVVPDGHFLPYFIVVLDFGGENDYNAHYLIGQKYAEALMNMTIDSNDFETTVSTFLRQSMPHRADFSEVMKEISVATDRLNRENNEFSLFSAEIEGMTSVLNSRKYGHVSQDHLWWFFIDENQLTLHELYLFNFICDTIRINDGSEQALLNGLRPDKDQVVYGKILETNHSDSNTGPGQNNDIGRFSGLHALHYFKNRGKGKDYVTSGVLGCLLVQTAGVKEENMVLSKYVSPEKKKINTK